jgi:predicted metalloprotease
MRWEGREESVNVEDRRGKAMQAGGMVLGGGLGSIVLLIILFILGANPRQLMEQAGQSSGRAAVNKPLDPNNDPDASLKKFVSVVMKDTEDVWNELFREKLNAEYQDPKLVIFNDQVRSACGVASSQSGPFYCSGDTNVYLDFSFFRQMKKELNAPGDFAMAYVIAHEVGHHVQNQLGILSKVQAMQSRASKVESNGLNVRLELQADYLAGVWAHHNQKLKSVLERGDLEEALNAAASIGDDILMKHRNGRPSKDLFTHGSSKQRYYFLKKGMQTGSVEGMMEMFDMTAEQLDAIDRIAK